MAKYRCPQCGAMNSQPDGQCRLCGTRLGIDAEPVVAPKAAAMSQDRRGLKAFFFIALGVVLLLALGAVLFGYAQSNKVLDTAKGAVPGLGANTSDGWNTVTDTDSGFAVSLPGTPTKETKEGTVTWTAKVAKDTVILVGYVPVAQIEAKLGNPGPGTIPPKEFLDQFVTQTVAAEPNAQLNERKPLVINGYPALYVDIYDTVADNKVLAENGNDGAARVFNRGVYILKGDRLYFVAVASLQKGAEQYDRVIQNFAFTS